MTDITDQEKRVLREWANENQLRDEETHLAARYILATVDAPEPTLAEELAHITEHLQSWTATIITRALNAATHRAKQMEHDLTEARAEVERLTADTSAAARHILATVEAPAPTPAEALRDMLEKRDACEAVSFSGLLARVEQVQQERDEARAEVESLAEERDRAQYTLAEVTNARDSLREDYDNARTEVERLTAERLDRNSEMRMLTSERNEALIEAERLAAENEQLRRTDNFKEFRDKFLTVQKGAESNAETPDPADVKPGEAWIVEVNGKRGTAMKDGDSLMPWGVVTDGTFSSRDAGEITLVARLVPEPRVITSPDELDALAEGSIVLDNEGDPATRRAGGLDYRGVEGVCNDVHHYLPVTVLWEPGA